LRIVHACDRHHTATTESRSETFAIAERLVGDKHDLVQKAVGGWIREAGRKDRQRLLRFLDEHAATMPRVMLRYAIEHLDDALRARYMKALP
jgi:3-methyladenine DNA glycosylase AlkD